MAGDEDRTRRQSTAAPAGGTQFSEEFTAANGGWATSGTVAWGANGGGTHTSTLSVTGQADWDLRANRTATVADGQVVRLAFKLSQTSSQLTLALDTRSAPPTPASASTQTVARFAWPPPPQGPSTLPTAR